MISQCLVLRDSKQWTLDPCSRSHQNSNPSLRMPRVKVKPSRSSWESSPSPSPSLCDGGKGGVCRVGKCEEYIDNLMAFELTQSERVAEFQSVLAPMWGSLEMS
jgi:hypothetical protein